MSDWKSRIETLYRPLAHDGRRRRNELMKSIADAPIRRSRSPRELVMKIAIRSSIAAGLLLAAGLSIVLLTDHPASAAEELQRVAEINAAYKGWIHVEAQGKLTTPGPPLPTTRFHMNTVDGTRITDQTGADGQRTVTMRIPARNEVITYDSSSGEIRRSNLIPMIAKGMPATAEGSLFTVSAMLAGFRKNIGREPRSIERATDNGSDRYDIVFFTDDQEARALCEAKGVDPMITRTTVWVTPTTDMIHKMQFVQQGVEVTARITYGKPEIRTLYDLNVPRDAKVIDNRPTADLASVLDRLDARAAKGLGDCLAVLTRTDLGENQEVDTSKGSVYLYATDADRWFIGYFRIGDLNGRLAAGTCLPEAPAGWPVPDVEQLVDQLKQIAPFEFWLMGEHKGWAASRSPTSTSFEFSRSVLPKERTPMLASLGIGGEIWPNRLGSLGGTGSKTPLEPDPNRPGLCGFRFEEPANAKWGSGASEHIIWIDPARDDVPTETVWRLFGTDTSTVTTEVSRQNLEYAQLPNGQWYPKRWRETRLSIDPRTPKAPPRTSVTECNLLVAPGMKLDKDWFVNPVEKFGQQK